MSSTNAAPVDFFISYTSKDKAWAEWIAWHLEAAGFQVIIQAWDFKAGGVFPADMHHALQRSARVIGVLSPAYLISDYGTAEWLAAFKEDPTGDAGRLVLVRVVLCEPTGLLAGRTYIDLVDKPQEKALPFLLEGLKPGRSKPPTAPPHPGPIAPPVLPAPAFPGVSSNNLPSINGFVGRKREIKAHLPLLLPDAPGHGTVIGGPGGMGKTTLSVRLAESAAPGNYDHVIFVTAKPAILDPHGQHDTRTYAVGGFTQMLDFVARRLQRPQLAQAPETERAKLLCEALADTRTLLILDNLETLALDDQKSLVAFYHSLPRTCKAILTCRDISFIKGLGGPLKPLTEADALKLLANLAKHNPGLKAASPAERRRLFSETGGNTLLMTWTAGQIGFNHCTTVSDALDHLRSCPPGNDPLEFIFGSLLPRFIDEELRILATLSYPAEPIPMAAIAEICALAEPVTRRTLKLLTTLSLVVPDPEEQTYSLVPMVADFLRQKNPEVVAATGTSLENRAYALIVENGYQKHDRFPTLDAAWPTVAPAIPLFVAGPSPRLQSVCDALQRFLDFTGRWDEWLALNRQAEAKALAAGDHDNAGWRAYHAGIVHYFRDQGDEVLACAARAASHWTQAQAGVREQSTALRLCSLGHRLKQDYPAALADARQSVELRRSLAAESADVATGLNDVAEIERYMLDFPAAERDYREALRIARAVGYAESVAAYTGNLAVLALDREDWKEAEARAREALPLAEKVGRKELVANDHHYLALALLRQDRRKEALPHAQQAVARFTSLGHPDLAAAQATLQECQA